MDFFWCFCLFVNLVVPVALIVLGTRYKKCPPKKLNSLFAYRTERATKDQASWIFAHKVYGNIWQKLGFTMIPVTIVSAVLQREDPAPVVGASCIIFCFIQLILGILASLPVEFILKKREKKLLESDHGTGSSKRKKKKKKR